MKYRDVIVLALGAVLVGSAWTFAGLVLVGLSVFPLDSSSGGPETSSWIVAYAPVAGTVLLLGSVAGYASGHPLGSRYALLAAGLCLLTWFVAVLVLEL